MMDCCELKYSGVRGKDVVDSKGENVGEVLDWIFGSKEKKLELKYFVLGGGTVEEFLESIGARPDIDPVIRLEDIESISDKIYLNIEKGTLKKTIDPGVLDETDYTFSKLSDVKVVDSDNIRIGFVIDIWFDKECVMWLVLGGGFFEELLERLKAQPDIDLLVPLRFIETISKDVIKLSITKSQLQDNCKDEVKKLQRQTEGTSSPDKALSAKLKLGS